MPLLTSLTREKAFQNAVTFTVDWDTQKDFTRTHEVRYQSTVIVYKGEKEMGRSTGDVDMDRLRALLEKGL